MELIPILSLIILFATISTFILAVGAYVLYKVRERKGRLRKAVAPATIQAELITPSPLVGEQKSTGMRRTYTEDQYSTRDSVGEFEKRSSMAETSDRGSSAGPQMRPTFVSSSYGESKYQKSDSEKSSNKRKFMRYTNEEPPTTKKEENKNEENLRWR
ncbi:MAG: hypothetical protein V1773_05585 [bacterium]